MDVYSSIQNDLRSKILKARTNFKKSPKDRVTQAYCETRIEALEASWSSFVEVHKTIIKEVPNVEFQKSIYHLEDVYELTEELYIDYKTELKECIIKSKGSLNFSSVPEFKDSQSISVKLPKISIRTFSGQYSEWPSFRDLFLSLVHNNNNLDDVQKLHYLKGHLIGEPEQLLRHVPITHDNYMICWKQLQDRYNNKRYLSNCILKRLMSQRNITTESSTSIRELLDTTCECLNALKSLGIEVNNWDVIVIYIISLKLDNESRKQWELKVSDSTDDLPKFAQFKEFLEHRFRSLEFLDTKHSKGTNTNVRNNNYSNPKALHVSTLSCPFCQEEHKLCNCKKFAKEEIIDRRSFVQSKGLCYNCLGSGHSVYSCRQSTKCRICKKRHHSLLHLKNITSLGIVGNTDTDQVVEHKDVVLTATTSSHGESTNIVCFSNNQSQVLLATALVKAESSKGSSTILRSLIDQGSQASFVTESVVQTLGLKKVPHKSFVSGLGNDESSAMTSKSMVSFTIKSLYDSNFSLEVKAHVLKKLTSFLPEKRVMVTSWSKLASIQLADPTFDIPNKIDILLGAEVYSQILEKGLLKGPSGYPMAQCTKLGWILSGQICSSTNNNIVSMHVNTQDDRDELLKKFWELESDSYLLASKKHFTEDEVKCEELFTKTTQRDDSGRYVVKLPLKNENPQCTLGNSREIASKRFHLLEKRLSKEPILKSQYSEVLQEYIELNHMEEVAENELNDMNAVYLPHHAVVRADKSTTKVRVVFDASCRGTNGVSLNMDLMVGPTLQPDLRHLIMRWRIFPICLVSDIVKMYRQVKISNDHTDYQRILWRDNLEDPIRHFRLLRVTFGTASAPYLAVRALQQLAYDEKDKFPEAADIVLNDFYMDDLMTGCNTVAEGRKIYNDLNHIMKKGGFELQKWSSNSHDLLKQIQEEGENEREWKIDDTVKILGVAWDRQKDRFGYSILLPPPNYPITKRKVVSDISRLFDPLGWIAPIIITAKIFIQKLWLAGIDWDVELPAHLLKEWLDYRSQLSQITQFSIPRWINTTNEDTHRELHGYCDASNVGYSAVVYLRVINCNGEVHVNLVTAKTKVSPIKQVSIPRLELCGAVLVAKLLIEVSQVLNIPKEQLHAWTDSSVVLAWLSSHPSRWKTFIANRVSEILSLLDSKQWSHVKSKENPADWASRGTASLNNFDIELWKHGPRWLQEQTIDYGNRGPQDTKLEEKTKKICVTTTQTDIDIWTKFSSLSKMIRVVAYCRRFLFYKSSQNRPSITPWLTSKELQDATNVCIRKVQGQCFFDDIDGLNKNKQVPKKSKLKGLNPWFDENGILRVGGRLQSAKIGENAKHPIILPRKSHLTDLIIADSHEKTLHGGPQLMINHLRSRYWILDMKNQVKNYVRKCVKCIRYAASTNHQQMGQLPPQRVTPCRVFSNSGVDYAGPINIRATKGRGHQAYKGYICLFICMATRAIHLEAVSDMTSHGFIQAFKRFVARRGHCSHLWSDNGSNFIGAARELRELLNQEKSTVPAEIADWLANNGTEWHFIPPRAPNFGGLWEAGIKSTKHHLKRVIANSTLTYEEISTVLAQIEACLNSRPLCQINNHPEDPEPLTPGHFLIQEPLVLVPESNYKNSTVSSLKRWQYTQKMVQDFWRKWSQEYLCQFLQRHKWIYQVPEPKIGDVVIVKEDDLPPARWLFGIIIDKHPGPDKITRVVTLRCKNSVIKRPVSKLCVLPLAE